MIRKNDTKNMIERFRKHEDMTKNRISSNSVKKLNIIHSRMQREIRTKLLKAKQDASIQDLRL